MQAATTLHPEQIIVATIDKTDVGYGTTNPAVSKLEVDASAERIGQTLRHHLALSADDVPAPTDSKASFQAFLTATGFKNAKTYYKGSKYLSVYQKNDEIVIGPTKNDGKGFVGAKDLSSIVVSAFVSDKELGEQIKEAWPRCIDNGA